MKCSHIVRGFSFGSVMGCAADLRLPHSSYRNLAARPPRKFVRPLHGVRTDYGTADVMPSFPEVVRPTQTDGGLQRNPNDTLKRERVCWEGKSFSRLTRVAAGEQKVDPD